MRIGVDVGGTFTDVVVQDDDGSLRTWKVSSTPPDFADGVLNGIEAAARDLEITESELLRLTAHFVHGTTVTTNVVLTRSGDRVGILTTRGFGDTYRLARQYRGHEQDPSKVSHPTPLVPREDIEEITERIDYTGAVVAPIDEAEVAAAVERLAAKGIRSFAICFLWSFRNSAHEELAESVVRRMVPDAYVAASYASCPVIGEYERTSTTAITAYTGPSLHRYAIGLESDLDERGLTAPLLIMKSDGGPASIEGAVRAAAQTIYSGPAAGVVAAGAVGEQLGTKNVITFDMGGTSTDVAIIHDGEVRSTTIQFLDRQALATPMIDVTTVGAGGGSIASTNVDGTLRVGPESAGALPGPACYGRGGTLPTVTDANLLLGLIDPDHFLGGQLILDRPAAEAAAGDLATRLGMSIQELAHGVFRVINAVMADAIRLRTVYAGLDPREFLLVSFGGGGGLHCAAVARELGISEVVVPRSASTLSAVGLVSANLSYSFTKATVVEVAPEGDISREGLDEVNSVFTELQSRARSELVPHGIPEERWRFDHLVELSYRGQILNFEIEVARAPLTAEDVAKIIRSFDDRYRLIYGPGAAAPDRGYTLKSYRLVSTAEVDKPPSWRTAGGLPGEVPKDRPRRRLALIDEQQHHPGFLEVHEGERLGPGAEIEGPAVIEFSDTNVFVPVEASAWVDHHGHLHLHL